VHYFNTTAGMTKAKDHGPVTSDCYSADHNESCCIP